MTYAIGCRYKYNSCKTGEEDGECGYSYYLHELRWRRSHRSHVAQVWHLGGASFEVFLAPKLRNQNKNVNKVRNRMSLIGVEVLT